MDQSTSQRNLANRFVRAFFDAFEAEVGTYSLHLMLREAGLEEYIDHLPPKDNQAVITADQFARFYQAIREYFGRGARGSLMRVGQTVFQTAMKESSPASKAKSTMMRLASKEARRKYALDFLTSWLLDIGENATVHPLDMDLVVVMPSSVTSLGCISTEPVLLVHCRNDPGRHRLGDE